jgi:hypothetical protein
MHIAFMVNLLGLILLCDFRQIGLYYQNEKNKKKFARNEKQLINFMIQDFLELEKNQIERSINEKNVQDYWEKLTSILYPDTFWMDEIEPEDLENTNIGELILNFHVVLKPLWDQFKTALIDYTHNVIPERESTQVLKQSVQNDGKASALFEYKDLLLQSDHAYRQQFYDIGLHLKVYPFIPPTLNK